MNTDAVRIPSRFDTRTTLHIDRANYAFWIEYHEDTTLYALRNMKHLAYSKGLIEDPEEDVLDMTEHFGNGMVRLYLVTRETCPDVPFDRSSMPDTERTAYGPLSGFMEAVT